MSMRVEDKSSKSELSMVEDRSSKSELTMVEGKSSKSQATRVEAKREGKIQKDRHKMITCSVCDKTTRKNRPHLHC